MSSMVFQTSCKDVMDVQPYDRNSEEIIWSSKVNSETFIYGTYGIMERYNCGPGMAVYTSNIQANDGTGRNAFQVYEKLLTITMMLFSIIGHRFVEVI